MGLLGARYESRRLRRQPPHESVATAGERRRQLLVQVSPHLDQGGVAAVGRDRAADDDAARAIDDQVSERRVQPDLAEADGVVAGIQPQSAGPDEFAILPSKPLEMPQDMDPVIASLAEPAATSLHAIYLADKVMHRPLSECRA